MTVKSFISSFGAEGFERKKRDHTLNSKPHRMIHHSCARMNDAGKRRREGGKAAFFSTCFDTIAVIINIAYKVLPHDPADQKAENPVLGAEVEAAAVKSPNASDGDAKPGGGTSLQSSH